MNYCTYFLFATRQNFGEDDKPDRLTTETCQAGRANSKFGEEVRRKI
jgi:hypothetical protein